MSRVLCLNTIGVMHHTLVNKQQFFLLLKHRGHWHYVFTETLAFWLVDKPLFFFMHCIFSNLPMTNGQNFHSPLYWS